MQQDLNQDKQDLYLVFGGELASLDQIQFRDLSRLEIIGFFPSYNEALSVWKGCAQSTVDNAHQRYFIVPIHEFLYQKTTA